MQATVQTHASPYYPNCATRLAALGTMANGVYEFRPAGMATTVWAYCNQARTLVGTILCVKGRGRK